MAALHAHGNGLAAVHEHHVRVARRDAFENAREPTPAPPPVRERVDGVGIRLNVSDVFEFIY